MNLTKEEVAALCETVLRLCNRTDMNYDSEEIVRRLLVRARGDREPE